MRTLTHPIVREDTNTHDRVLYTIAPIYSHCTVVMMGWGEPAGLSERAASNHDALYPTSPSTQHLPGTEYTLSRSHAELLAIRQATSGVNPLPFLITYSVIRVVRAFPKPPYAAAARSHALYTL